MAGDCQTDERNFGSSISTHAAPAASSRASVSRLASLQLRWRSSTANGVPLDRAGQPGQVRQSLGCGLEARRELREQRPEPPGLAQRRQRIHGLSQCCRRGLWDRREIPRRRRMHPRMRELLVQLDREFEARRRFRHPLGGDVRRQIAIERRVHLHGAKSVRIPGEFVHAAPGLGRRIDDAGPRTRGPADSANRRCRSGSAGGARPLLQFKRGRLPELPASCCPPNVLRSCRPETA